MKRINQSYAGLTSIRPRPLPHSIAPLPTPQSTVFIVSKLYVSGFSSDPSKRKSELILPERFLYVSASSLPPLVGYLLANTSDKEFTFAIRVEISAQLDPEQRYVVNGTLGTSFGRLRTSGIADWHERIALTPVPWIPKLWKRIGRRLTSKRLLNDDWTDTIKLDDVPSGQFDFYPNILLDHFLTDSERRFIAIVALWSYWTQRREPVKDDAKCDDLFALGLGKKSGGRNQGGEALGGKVTKGAFTNTVVRAGISR